MVCACMNRPRIDSVSSCKGWRGEGGGTRRIFQDPAGLIRNDPRESILPQSTRDIEFIFGGLDKAVIYWIL